MTTTRQPKRTRSAAHLLAAVLAAGALSLISAPSGASAAAPYDWTVIETIGRVGGIERLTPRILLPSHPAVAGRPTPIAQAAATALAALWFSDATYDFDVAKLVNLVAAKAGLDPAALADAWARAGRERMTVVLSALTQVGVPYRAYKAIAGTGFDCSGFTSWAWSQVGIDLPHQSRQQINLSSRVSPAQVLPGDLVYYPGHVMLALGVGEAIVQAPHSGAKIDVAAGPSKRRQRWTRLGSPIG
jgi:cell wall-associated NlpC family hydrolase